MRDGPKPTEELTEPQTSAIAKALADPRRFRILTEIAAAGTLDCQAMRATHDVSAATISHHIRELESAGLIEIGRIGKFARLTFRADRMNAYLARLGRILGTTP